MLIAFRQAWRSATETPYAAGEVVDLPTSLARQLVYRGIADIAPEAQRVRQPQQNRIRRPKRNRSA